jgi:eukaryotic-like serine/threonine-protein kinase
MTSSEQGAQRGGLSAPDRLPRRFGRYLLFDKIGRGGMADIYLARAQTELGAGRRVVVKQILPELSGDERFARMLTDEAKLVAGLSHANIAQVIDLGREEQRLFITMEYIEGFDLNQMLRMLTKQRIPLGAEFALFIVREMLAALDFAHRAVDASGKKLGIVHRDVSPSNVLVSFEGEVKLCDFGIAKALGFSTSSPLQSSDAGSRERSQIAGKAAYMSPEHARGEPIDLRADLFSAGIVLWELCAGRRLYKGTDEQMLELARAADVPKLPDRGLPRQDELQVILDRALAVAPAERWQNAAEMLHAIDEYAVHARLFASQIRFGAFLSQHFELEVIRTRRDRERAAEALEHGPPVQIALVEPAAESVDAKPPENVPELAALDTRPLRASSAPPRRRGKALAVALAAGIFAIAALAIVWALWR